MAANFCTAWYFSGQSVIISYQHCNLKLEISTWTIRELCSFIISCSKGRHDHRVINSKIHFNWLYIHLLTNCEQAHTCGLRISGYLGIFEIVFDAARRHLVSYRSVYNLLITHPPAPFNSISLCKHKQTKKQPDG